MQFKIQILQSYVIIFVISLCVLISWYLSNYPRKNKKGKIGFIISLYCSDEKENKKIREDFIITIKNQLLKGSIGSNINVIVMPSIISQKIETLEDAQKLRIKYRSHFMIYGRVRLREIENKKNHIIDLNGIVSHNPIPDSIQRQFTSEFGELFPTKIHIDQENDIFSFDFTSDFIEIVSKYIIGIAAGVSGDLLLAELLFHEVSSELSSKDKRFPIYKKLLDRVPLRIAEVQISRAQVIYRLWTKTYNKNLIETFGAILESVNLEQRRNQVFGILHSVFLFLYDRDIKNSILSLRENCPDRNFNWYINYAFLHAYSGQLVKVTRHFHIISTLTPNNDTIYLTEEFTSWVLENEPTAYTLYYYLGLLNWKVKGDLELAIKDFNSFIENADINKYRREIDMCKIRIPMFKKGII